MTAKRKAAGVTTRAASYNIQRNNILPLSRNGGGAK